MKAKDLITGKHLYETGGLPPDDALGGLPPVPQGQSGPRRPFRIPGGPHGMGRPTGPPRLFAGPEEGALKDIMLLFLTEVAGNSYDGAIVRKLVEGKDLDRGELQHVLDEGARIQNLPESHAKVLEKIHQLIQKMPPR